MLGFCAFSQRAARAYARAEAVDRPGRLLHDLERRAVAVRRRVRRVGELLGHENLRILLRHALGDGATLGDGVADVARVVHEDHLRAVVPHELAPLLAHAVGHHDHGLVAPDSAHEREADALVAARRLDDDGVRIEHPARLGVADHVVGRARLDGAAHVERLEFHQNLGAVRVGHTVQADQRRLSHRFQYVVVNHSCTFLSEIPIYYT